MISRSELNRRLGYPKVKARWLRSLVNRRILDWYRTSSLCQSVGSGMQTPIESTFRHLELRGLCPSRPIVLELFGGLGLSKTVDLVRRAEHVTHIEIEEALSHHARLILPQDKTAFLTEDGIKAVREKRLPRRDYNFIHIDNECGRFGSYCENFELFPEIVECLGASGVLVFNVFLDIEDRHPDAVWLRRRQEFFGLGSVAEAVCLQYEQAKSAYLSRIPLDRFVICDAFPVPHYGHTISLVIALERVASNGSATDVV